jgi:NAD(P)H-nitrite reductase large subunit
MKHVILGNGPAGVIAAETIRKRAPQDQIVMIGSEDEPPYSRMAIPYLLMGNIEESGTYLRKDIGYFEKLNIEQVRAKASSVDIKNKKIDLGGQSIAFDKSSRIMWPVNLTYEGSKYVTTTNGFREWNWLGG